MIRDGAAAARASRASWFIVGEVASQSQGLLIFFLFARNLDENELAAFSAILAVTWVSSVVLGFGAEAGFSRYFQAGDPQIVRSLTSTYSSLIVFGSTLFLAAATLVDFDRVQLLFGPASSRRLLLAGMILAGINSLQATLILAIRNLDRARAFAILAALQSFFAVLVAFILLREMGNSALPLLLAAIVASAAFLLPRAYLVRSILGSPDVSLARELLKFGLPLLPAALLTTLASHVDRVLLLELAGPVPASRYAVAATLASTLVVLGYAFAHVFTPLALRAHFLGAPGAARARGAALFVLVAFLGSAVVGLCWSAVGLLALLGGRHGGGGAMLPYLGWAFVAGASFQVTSLGLVVEKRTLAMLGLTAAAFAAKLGLTFALLPRVGAIAAPMATLASQFALTFAAARSGRATTPFAVRRIRLAVLTVGLVALSALGSHLSLGGATAWLAGGLSGLVALGMALALGLRAEVRTMLEDETVQRPHV